VIPTILFLHEEEKSVEKLETTAARGEVRSKVMAMVLGCPCPLPICKPFFKTATYSRCS